MKTAPAIVVRDVVHNQSLIWERQSVRETIEEGIYDDAITVSMDKRTAAYRIFVINPVVVSYIPGHNVVERRPRRRRIESIIIA